MQKRLPVRSVPDLAGVAIALSILLLAIAEACIPQYRVLFGTIFPSFPDLTILTFGTYRLVLLTALLSIIVWILFKQGLLTEAWGVRILQGAIALTLLYAILGLFTLLLPFVLLLQRVG